MCCKGCNRGLQGPVGPAATVPETFNMVAPLDSGAVTYVFSNNYAQVTGSTPDIIMFIDRNGEIGDVTVDIANVAGGFDFHYSGGGTQVTIPAILSQIGEEIEWDIPTVPAGVYTFDLVFTGASVTKTINVTFTLT